VVVVSSEFNRESLIQFRNQMFNELISYVSNHSNSMDSESYRFIMNMINQIDFINKTLDSPTEDRTLEKRKQRRKSLGDIYKSKF
jgi:hypothetical protein